MRIVSVGAGKLAHHLIPALSHAEQTIEQVYSRGASHAESLGSVVGSEVITDLNELNRDADIYIISVSDDALQEVGKKVLELCPNSLIVHTAGTKPMSVLQGQRIGVIYPMQTFSFNSILDFNKIHIFIEALHKEDEYSLLQLCSSISEHIHVMSSDERRYLHLAAVFACNFVNHCYSIADNILKQLSIPFDVMFNLIDETCDKVHNMSPKEAQTGPAARRDISVMSSHLQLLKDNPDTQRIYQLMSDNIMKELSHDQL